MIFEIILSLMTATFVVTGRNSVQAEGAPESGSTVFQSSATTGQIGQMTAGNTTELLLTGWGGTTLTSLTVEMKSNASAGAGSMVVTAGNQSLWTIDSKNFSDPSWYGAYSSDWVKISHNISYSVGDDDTIRIRIEATKNSLYVHSYTITYEPAPERTYTVCMHDWRGDSPCVMETSAGAGVDLSTPGDTAEWHFAGWSTQRVTTTDQTPTLITDLHFYPTEDTHLWAVYTNQTDLLQQTEAASGTYILAGTHACKAISVDADGAVSLESVQMDTCADGRKRLLSVLRDEMYWNIELTGDSTLRLVHDATGAPLGYTSSWQLTSAESEWSYRWGTDSTLIIYTPEDATYNRVLYMYYSSPDMEYVLTIRRFAASSTNKSGFVLFPKLENVVWSSDPMGLLPVESVSRDHGTRELMRIGNWTLWLQDGQKVLTPQ